MLKHVARARSGGTWVVCYLRPGSSSRYVAVCDCLTESQAKREAERLNREQRAKYIPPKTPGRIGKVPQGFYSDAEG